MKTIICLLALACFTGGVYAQSYPSQTVRVVVVYPPGGSNDIVARIVFRKMTELTGQQFVIENRGGAGGTIGSEVVAQSPADGYTLMVQSATHVANPHLYKNLPYDVFKDFIGIAPLARQVGVLAVHPSLPVSNLPQFIKLAKARPGEINYGSAGNGTFVHLSMALLANMTGVKMIHVPYKGGGPAGSALVSGETQAQLGTIGSLLSHIKSKRVRALAVSSDQRVQQMPDIPAIAESVPGYEFTAWVGCFAPAGTPKAVVDKLNADLGKALSDPLVAKALEAQTLDPLPMSVDAFEKRLQADYDKYERVIKLSGARLG